MENLKREPKVEEYKDANGDNQYRVIAGNGEIIGRSEEGKKNIAHMRKIAVEASVAILRKYNPELLK